jgi:outer membrane protein insertion porin family
LKALYIKAKYKTDLEKVIAQEKDIETQEYFLIPLILDENALSIKINVEEGNKYYFEIKF